VDLVSTDPNRPGIFAFGQFSFGVIAFGQAALGVVAIGQLARGVLCVGQGAIGVSCIGQGAIGLWHATGMVGLAGPRGYGIVAHLLPVLVPEPVPALPDIASLDDIVEGRIEGAWVDAKIFRRDGAPQISIDGAPKIDGAAVRAAVERGLAAGCDRARVKLRREAVVDAGGYREAETHAEFFVDDVVAYWSRPPKHLAYGRLPKGAPGPPATSREIALRSIGYFFVLAIVFGVSLLPLASSLFGFELAWPAFGD
jgi:hypothetical protein